MNDKTGARKKNTYYPLISVIIPVYNVEDYLRDCLDSVINQIYDKLEIIIIDDGSTDNCPQICDEYLNVDHRITVIHKKNGGQGSARNVGLDTARGEYFTFLDSDDYWDPDHVSFLLEIIQKEDADIAICDYCLVDEEGKRIKQRAKFRHTSKILTGEQAMINALYWNDFGVAPWAKLFKSHLWSNIRFKEDRIYEDLATTYLVYDKASKVVFDNNIKMSYRIRANSDAHQPFNVKKIRTLDSADEILAYCIDRNPQVVKAARSRELASACFVFFRIPKKELHQYIDTVIRCKRIIRKYRWGVMADRKARKKTRVGALCSFLGFSFERWLFSKVVK